MLEERRLDIVIYESLVKHIPAGQQLPDNNPDDETLVAAGVAALNEVYGESGARAMEACLVGFVGSVGWSPVSYVPGMY